MKDSQKTQTLALRAIWLGLVAICIPTFLSQLILAQPQCAPATHPLIHALAEKCFDLLGKIGDACIIGGLIGIVIDEGLKTRFIQEVVRAASPKLLGQHLPEPVRELLLNYFKTNFVRPEWDIQYEIMVVDRFPNFVKVTSRIQGTVQNCGSETEEFELVSSLDPAPSEPGESLITRVSMNPESGPGGFDDFLTDNASLCQPDGSKLYRRTLALLPGARIKTVLETIEYHPTSAVLPLFAVTTVVRSIVRIRYPKDLLEIQVATGTSTGFRPEPSQWGAEWEIPTVILPGQSIVVTWNPKTRITKVPAYQEASHLSPTPATEPQHEPVHAS